MRRQGRDSGRSSFQAAAALAALLAAPALSAAPGAWTAADADAAGGLNAAASAAAYSPQFMQAGGRAHAVWHEDGRIRAAVYNGDDGTPGWSPIDAGAGLNREPGRRAEAPALAALGPVLYAAWHEFNGSAYQVRAAAYDGASWSFADGGGAAGLNVEPRLNALNPHLAVAADKVYAVWQESDGSRRRVRAAVKTGAGWIFIDGGGLDAGGADAVLPQLSVFGAKLYASWQEDAAAGFRARVAVYNGDDADPRWTPVSGPGLNADSTCRSEPVRLAASSVTLHAAWCEEGPSGRRVRAAVYNGSDSSPAWSFIDGGGFGGPEGSDRSMVQMWVYRGRLHLSYQQADAAATVVRAAVYEGGSWPFIDGGGLNRDPLRSGAFPAFGVYRSGLYAIWTEASGSSSWIRLARAHHAPEGARAAVVLDTSLTAVWESVGAPLGYVLEASTAPDFSGVVTRQTTADREAAALTLSGLSPLTTYHVRLGAVYSGSTLYAAAMSAMTAAPLPADDSSLVRAAVASPEAGKSVGGGRLLVLASVLRGEAVLSSVLFQYRRPGGPWADMPAARADYPNPARQKPYWTYWDLSDPAAFPPGDYELRARAESADGAADEQAPVAAVRLDRADPDIEGTVLSPDSVQVRQRLSNAASGVVSAAEPGEGLLTEVTMPAGALDAATTTLRLVVNPPGVPPAPGLEAAGVFREITLESGQTRLAGGRMATVVMGYADADSDGFVDGTAVRAERLRAYSYDPLSAAWTRDFDSVVDTQGRTVTAQTPHFTLFGLFAPAAADLSAARVYPVPYVPGDGLDDNGKPFSAGDPTSGILFDNLTADASVTVYSLLGRRVWRGPAPGAAGVLRWDAHNEDGRAAATGSYFAVIESPAGGRAVRRLAIIR